MNMNHRIVIDSSLISNIWPHLCIETATVAAAGSQYSLMRQSRAHDAMHELITLTRDDKSRRCNFCNLSAWRAGGAFEPTATLKDALHWL